MVIESYKDTLARCVQMVAPVSREYLNPILDYSINKRFKDTPIQVQNTYKNTTKNTTLLQMANYIMEREPIVTAHGTMFKKHGTVPNPMLTVVQQFLDARSQHKKAMFKYPKGSEEFEKYNLLQQLDKIDVNGLYGTLGMYTSLIFNINVSTSITSQGRALISSATMMMESFLSGSVQFGSLDEVLVFIDHVKREKRTYNDSLILDGPVSIEDCFAKIVMSCGYRWIPDDSDLDVIWQVINNLGQEDLNRVYYKNNLYEFLSNNSMKKAIKLIMKTLKRPFFNSLECPEEIEPMVHEFAYILKEYVYYDKMIIDRIDRCDTMKKSVIMVSDTDSCIVSLDAWYRFALDLVKDEDLQIPKTDPQEVIHFMKKDEFGDFEDPDQMCPIYFEEPDEDFDFYNDEIIQKQHLTEPFVMLKQDWLRYSIINVMAYCLDILINDYMEKFTINNHSYSEDRKCKILMKNEFTFLRILMTLVKKHYASLQAVQEGNIVPEDKQLDAKGIECFAKSTVAKSTRDALSNILLEDILRADTIDQLKIIKDLAILEKKIIDSIHNGSTEYYKPVTIKSISTYKDPMRIQGVKASVVWNALKAGDLEGINLDERNSIWVVKCDLNLKNVDDLLGKYGDLRDKAVELLNMKEFGGKIDAVAIPIDTEIPEWVKDIVNYKSIVNDNIGGFPIESIGIQRMGNRNINYTNIIQF